MKHARLVIAVLLAVASLVTGCAQAGNPASQQLLGSMLTPAASFGPSLTETGNGQNQQAETRKADGLFGIKFEGENVAGTGETVDGKYVVNATKTDGEAWHIKLEANYPTSIGHDYFVTYHFHSDVAGTVKFGDFQEFPIVAGDNAVTGRFVARAETSYLDLQLGMLSPFTIEFTDVTVEELTDDCTYEAISGSIGYASDSSVYESHDDGYTVNLTRNSDDVTAKFTQIPSGAEVWKAKLFVKTGAIPENGNLYRISADLTASKDLEYEVCFNNAEKEKGYSALYGLRLNADETKTVEQLIAIPESDFDAKEVVLQFAFGKAAKDTEITVTNVRVEKVVDKYTNVLPSGFALDKTIATGRVFYYTSPDSYTEVPLTLSFSGTDTVYEGHDDGYIVNVEETADSATLHITQAPENPEDRGVWKAKLYAETGVVLEEGTTYRIGFDITGTKDQAKYEACFDGDYENAYGALYDRSLKAGETEHIEMIVTPDVSHGPLTIRLQMGETDTAEGNDVTIKNLTVEKLTTAYQEVGEISYDTGATGNVSEEHFDGVEQTLSAAGTSATLEVTAARTDGGVWSSKLNIKTSVTPEAGEKYRVSLKVEAEGETGDFEVLYQNTAGGELYGGQWGLSGSGEYSSDFTAPAENCGPMTIVLQLGNAAAGTKVTVSEIQICKLGGGAMEEVALTGFAYPVTTEGSAANNSFELEANSGAAAVMGGDGTSATATVTTPGDDWHVKFYAKTGLTLEAGETYKITMNVTGAAGCTACYKNTATGAEDGFGTQTITDGEIVHTVTSEQGGGLEIMLKIGNVAAGTVVTISGIQIEKISPVTVSVLPPAMSYPSSFDLEANSGAEAVMGGEGSSATATVTKPGADWNVKFYAKPHVTLKSGKTYQVTLHVTNASGCPVCFKNLATGEEEGFGTVWLSSNDETVTHTITPSADAKMEIMLKIGNLAANTEVAIDSIDVMEMTDEFKPVELTGFAYPVIVPESTEDNSFFLEANSGAAAKMTGDGSSATAQIQTSGDDWHIKFYAITGLELEAGKTYEISFNVTGAAGCQVCYKNTATGKEDGFGTETAADGVVTHTVTPDANGALEIMLKLGTVAAGNTVTVSNVKISALGGETVGENLFTDSLTTDTRGNINFWAHEDYAAELSGDGSSATLKITKAPEDTKEAWKIKLFVETGIQLEEGKHYRISADLSATAETDYEICYNDGAEEKGVGALYGQHAGAQSQTAVYEVTAEKAAELILQINLGWAAPCEVTVSNVKVEVMVDGVGESVLPSFKYDSVGSVSNAADNGYVTELEKAEDSATFRILQAPEERNPWNVKLFVKTGFTPEKGKGYRVSFDIEGEKNQGLYEVFYDGSSEAAYGALYEQVLSEGKKQTVSYIIEPGDEKGELVLQIRLGKTDGTEGNVYKVSNVKVEEVTFKTTTTPEIVTVTTLWTHEDYSADLTTTEDSASVKIVKVPSDGKEPWKTKLFIDTGVTLKEGEKYRITFEAVGSTDIPFEVCYNRDGEEKGLGAIYGLTATAEAQVVMYTTYVGRDTHLVIQVSLGNASAGNVFTIRNLKVERAGSVKPLTEAVYVFE